MASRVWLPVLLLLLATAWVSAPGLHGPLIFDDVEAIERNPDLRAWPGWIAAWDPPYRPVGFSRRPVVHVTMLLNHAAGGLQVEGYRLVNAALHALAVVLLFALMRETLRHGRGLPETLRCRATAAAFFAALLWAVHPLSTSAVNYLTQRGELLVAASALASLLCWGRAMAGGRPVWLAAAWLACLAGMGSKESMLGFPLAAALYHRTFHADSWREVLRRWPAYALLLLTTLWPVARLLGERGLVGRDVAVGAEWMSHYWLMQAWGLGRMVRLTFWPSPLILDYGMGLVRSAQEVWPQLLFLAATAILVLRGAWRGRAWAFCPALAAVVLLPPVFFPVLGQPVGEHRFYLPLAALLAWTVGLIARWLPPRRAAGWTTTTAALLLAVIWAGMTRQRQADYADPMILWQQSLAFRPDNERAAGGIASVHLTRGEQAEAVAWADRALALRESYTPALETKARGLQELGRHAEAVAAYRELTRRRPAAGGVWMNLGALLALQGENQKAIEALRQAVQLLPTEAGAWFNLGLLLANRGETTEAIAALDRAAALQPGNPRYREVRDRLQRGW